MSVTSPKVAGKRALAKNSIPFSPTLASAVGVCGALVAQQIYYWTTLNRNIRDGHSWVYKTYEDIVADVGRYSVSTVKRALSRLKEAKVIVVGKRMNAHAYDKTNWYRVDKEVLDSFMKASPSSSFCPNPSGQNEPNPSGQNEPIHRVKMDLPIPETTAETTTETTAPQPAFGGCQEQPTTSTKEGEAHGEEKMNAEDILKHLREKNKINQGTGVQAMSLLWKKRTAVGDSWQKDLTQKELRQLKVVRDAAGVDAISLLDIALSNWQVFSNKAWIKKGVSPASSPNCGFFCQHWDIARLMSASPPVAPPPQKTQSIAVVSTNTAETPDNTESKATEDEVQQAIELFAALAKPKG